MFLSMFFCARHCVRLSIGSACGKDLSPQTGMIYAAPEKGIPGGTVRAESGPLSSTSKFSELLRLRCSFSLSFGRQMDVAVPFILISWREREEEGGEKNSLT